jgi:hypothetical protein
MILPTGFGNPIFKASPQCCILKRGISDAQLITLFDQLRISRCANTGPGAVIRIAGGGTSGFGTGVGCGPGGCGGPGGSGIGRGSGGCGTGRGPGGVGVGVGSGGRGATGSGTVSDSTV